MTWSAAAVRNLKFFSPVGGAAAAFIDYRRRRRRLGSLHMKNSFQHKKNLFISISECQSIQKTIENNYYVPPHDMYNNQNTKLKLTSADTYKQ